MNKPVIYNFDEATGVATIQFSRPGVLNAVDLASAQAFNVAVMAACEARARCIVLTGAGNAFVAGGDVGAFAANLDDASGLIHGLLDAINPALVALRKADAPVLAVVRGPAAGAGLSLVLGADLVLASNNAIFQIAYDRLGAQPDCGGTWFLERRVGRGRAFGLMFTGKRLSARDANAYGIVDEVVEDGELDARAQELASKIASGPTAAYGRFKKLIDDAPACSLEVQLEAERSAFVAATRSADFSEGVAAFAAKRPPQFKGR
ncbi:enoyl-CoA hydratase/isomerase family protein [Massilia cavernae]|uniref:Enoyl-CoA hydratase n=1 Tax=Massilia cavernae TaxID=2320864 RepID=A0A418Y8K1_9BURK|nr:enoyl-CoA hydratase-related protein [Massilia cavernae]RJG27766.1 enoyl-CoA hydratase [Massilia cavernae]